MIMQKIFALSLLLLAWQQPEPRKIPVKGYRLIWRDEFNGNRLDPSKWFHRNPGLHGESYNVPHTVHLDGRGRLILKGIVRPDSILASQISTQKLFQTTYGYFECRAKLPMRPGSLPAFWLQSNTNGEFGQPRTHGVELDIFEYWPHQSRDSITHGLHYGGYGATHKVHWPVWAPLKKPLDGYHVFGLEWTPTNYKLFVDGVVTYSGGEKENLISHKPEFIVLSLDMSRKFAGGDGGSWSDSMIVDYVRVYKRK